MGTINAPGHFVRTNSPSWTQPASRSLSPHGSVRAIGSHRVTVGPAAKIPASFTNAAQELKAFLQSTSHQFASGLDSLQNAVVRTIGERSAQRAQEAQGGAARKRTPAEVRAALSQSLPAGVTVSNSGSISGKIAIDGYPKGNAMNHPEQSFSDEFKASFEEQLQKNKFGDVDGVKISSQAKSDLYRLDLTVASHDSEFKTSELDEKIESSRTQKVTEELTKLTGDKTATMVLSSVVHQGLSRPMSAAMTDKAGNGLKFSPLAASAGTQKFRLPDGSLSDVVPMSIGGMRLHVSQDENRDFKVAASWPYYVTGANFGFEKKVFEGMDGAVTKVEGRFEMTVSAGAAKAGRLEFVSPPKATMEFSGQMAAEYCDVA